MASREEAGHPAERREERQYDPRQEAQGRGAAQECPAEGPAVFMMDTFSDGPLELIFTVVLLL